MIPSTQNPPPIPSEKAFAVKPSFFLALRGIWLFAWKSQLTWRRAPLLAIGLLVLPAMVYLTTPSPRNWTLRQNWAGNPAVQVQDFSRRLTRPGLQLRPEQRADLERVFTEEYARAQQDLQEAQSSEATIERQRELIDACFDRIHSRAQPLLDGPQFNRFQSFEKKKRLESLEKVRQPLWARSGPFYHWLIDFYFWVLLPLNCARTAGALIRDELQTDTLGFLATRPLSRAKLIAAKYLSQTAWMQLLLVTETLLLFGAGALRQIPALGSLLGLFLAAQFLAVLAWSALGTFLGLISKWYMALALVYGFIVELGIGRIPTNINSLSLMRHLNALLGKHPSLAGIHDWPVESVALSAGALVFAAFLFLGLASLLFTFKEYHHTTEMQK